MRHPLVFLSPPLPGFPATFEGLYCRLSPEAIVTISETDMSVMVSTPAEAVLSAAEGFADFEDDFGNHYTAHTAGLYLAAAEAQSIEIRVVERHIDPLTGGFIRQV